MDLQLRGKRALVSGGSRGIGLAVARALLDEGAEVAIAARDKTRLSSAARELAGSNTGKVVTASFDVRDEQSVADMVGHVAARLGGIDILVNSAAPPGGGSYRWNEFHADALLGDLDVKALGYLRCAQHVVPLMVANGWGRIINVAGENVRKSN